MLLVLMLMVRDTFSSKRTQFYDNDVDFTSTDKRKLVLNGFVPEELISVENR